MNGGTKVLEETIRKISETESKADEIVENAKVRAREIIDEAQKKSEDSTKRILSDAAEQSRQVIKSAEVKGADAHKASLEEVQLDCAYIEKTAEKNMNAAVSYIVGKVVGT